MEFNNISKKTISSSGLISYDQSDKQKRAAENINQIKESLPLAQSLSEFTKENDLIGLHVKESIQIIEKISEEIKNKIYSDIKSNNLLELREQLSYLNIKQKWKLLKLTEKNSNKTALYLAVEKDNPEIVALLLEGFNPEQKIKLIKIAERYFSYTPLSNAIKIGNLTVLKLLLEGLSISQKYELLKNQDKNTQNTEWHKAIKTNNLQVIELLLDGINLDKKYKALNIVNKTNYSVFHAAVDTKNLDIITLLLKGLNIEQKLKLLKIRTENYLHTPLHIAVATNNIQIVALLLEGITVEEKDDLLQRMPFANPYHAAILNKNIEMQALLLDGLNEEQHFDVLKIGTADCRRQVFDIALKKYDENVIKLLLKGVNLINRIYLLEENVSYRYCNHEFGNMEKNTVLLNLLLEGLSIDEKFEFLKKAKTEIGHYTPLHIFVDKQKTELVESMLDGLSIDQKYELLSIQLKDFGFTPLHIAIGNRDLAMLKILLGGLSTNQKFELFKIKGGIERNTLLHMCLKPTYEPEKIIDIIEFLIDQIEGFSQNQKLKLFNITAGEGSDIYTVLGQAAKKGNLMIVESLLKKLSLEQKVALIAVNSKGYTALGFAICSRNNSIADLFLDVLSELSVDEKFELLNKQDPFYSDFCNALCYNNQLVIKSLLNGLALEQKTELINKAKEYNSNSIFGASINNSKEMILLEKSVQASITQDAYINTKIRLYEAIKNNDLLEINKILSSLNIDELFALLKMREENSNSTALHIAVNEDNLNALQSLLKFLSIEQKYVLLKIVNTIGTPLHIALEKDNLEIIKLLLDELSLDQKYELFKIQVGIYNYTIICAAFTLGNPWVTNFLVEFLAELNTDQKFELLSNYILKPKYNRPKSDHTVFDAFLSLYNITVVRPLLAGLTLEQKAKLSAIDLRKEKILNQRYIHSEEKAIIDLLEVELGLRSSITESTYLEFKKNIQYYIKKNNLSKIKKILKHLSIEERYKIFMIQNEERTVLHTAIDEKNVFIIESLLSGFNEEQKTHLLLLRNGFTGSRLTVLEAAIHTTPAVVCLLLNSFQADQKYNLLMLAKKSNRALLSTKKLKIIKLFLKGLSVKQKLDLLIQDPECKINCNPLYTAVFNNRAEIVALFLNGLTLEQKIKLLRQPSSSNPNYTVLHAMCWCHKQEILESLLKGLSSDQKLEFLMTQDEFGRTALFDASNLLNITALEFMIDGLSVEQKIRLLELKAKSGNTVLHEILRVEKEETQLMIKLLISGLSTDQKSELFSIKGTFGLTVRDMLLKTLG